MKTNLGLNEQNFKEIISTVQIIINCAASVDFNARLDESLLINVKGTKNMFDLACQVKNLLNFVHVSTAYVNSDKQG